MSANPKEQTGKEEAPSSTTTPSGTASVTEGSAVMHYPADQESTVFYNPVQVQNRDLSILMISLFAERRAVQQAVTQYRRQLNQQEREERENEESQNNSPNDKGEVPPQQSKAEKVAAFKANLDPTQAVLDMMKNDQSSNGLCILDALAASGLRSMRYWMEIPGVHHVTINDLDPVAIQRARANIVANNLQNVHLEGASSTSSEGRRPRGICTHVGDATAEMYNSRPKSKLRPGSLPEAQDRSWDVIDLDPYGSAAPFLDAAVQSAVNGGLLCITCTDMAALGGSHPETCVGRYGAMPIQRAPYLQELALRILLQTIAVTAAKYGRSIHPVLSVGMNFYVRVFVTVHDKKDEVNQLSLNLGYVHQSTQCPSFFVVPMGQLGGQKKNTYRPGRIQEEHVAESGASMKIAGPIWTGPLHDRDVIQTALDRLSGKTKTANPSTALLKLATKDRLRGLLLSCRDELPDVPLFYRTFDMAQSLRTSAPPLRQVQYALINAGYKVSGYHKEPQAVKTNAPNKVVWDIMKVWYKQMLEKDPKTQKPAAEGSLQEKLLARPIETNVDFSEPKQEDLPSFLKANQTADEQVARFPGNPEANWGPKKATTGYKRKAEEELPNPKDT